MEDIENNLDLPWNLTINFVTIKGFQKMYAFDCKQSKTYTLKLCLKNTEMN